MAFALLGSVGCKELPQWGLDGGERLWFYLEPLFRSTTCPAGQSAPVMANNEIRWWTQHAWDGEVPPLTWAVSPQPGQPERRDVMTWMWEGSVPKTYARVTLASEARDIYGRLYRRWNWDYGITCPFVGCDPAWVAVYQRWGIRSPRATLQVHRANGCDQWAEGYITCVNSDDDCDLPIFTQVIGEVP